VQNSAEWLPALAANMTIFLHVFEMHDNYHTISCS